MTNIKRLHSNLYFVKDLAKTAEFYEKLGFDVDQSDDTVRIKPGDFTLAFMDESKVQIDKEAGMEPKGLGIFTYVEVENVDEQHKSVVANGVQPSSEPTSFPWGKREFAVKDPDGFKIIFYQNIKDVNDR
ncbi:VOC family protein [Candidatus Saccharibacteria bacterium]|nr:VOC family protein [Candidatus Saccharibacteria bacterium]